MKRKGGNSFNLLFVAEENENSKLISKRIIDADITVFRINSIKELVQVDKETTFFLIVILIDTKSFNNEDFAEFLKLLVDIPFLLLTDGQPIPPVLIDSFSKVKYDSITLQSDELTFQNRIKFFKELFENKNSLKLALEEIDTKKRRIAEEDQKFKIVTSTINKPVIFVDHNQNITFWNNEAQSLLGYTKFEVLNESFLRWIIGTPSQELICGLFNDVAKAGAKMIKRTYQLIVKTKLKVEIEIDTTISYIKSGDKGFSLVFVFHDNSNERRLEKETIKVRELTEENKLLREFAHNVSHELRTPLNAIMGISKTLIKYNSTNLTEKQKEGLDIVHKCGSQLVNMISDLLNLSRLDSNRLKLNEEEFKFDKFLSLQKSQILQLIEKKPVKFLIKKSPSIPNELIADHRKIGQVLTNLLSNSVKFTENGKIILSCHLVDNKLFFEIADTGIGIPENKMKVIFEKFRQVENSTYNTMGAGLGLHIAKKLVALMQGEITAESEETKGTIVRFYITLSGEIKQPVALPVITNSERTDVVFLNYKPESKLVLIIDDSVQNSFLYSMLGEQSSYSTILCKNGKAGLAAAVEYLPDIIILKLEIPGLHGTSIIRELENKQIHIPILAISYYETPTFVLSPSVKFLTGVLGFEQLLEKLNELSIHIEKTKTSKIVIYESQSWLQDEKVFGDDAFFIENKNLEHTFIQIFRKNCDYLFFEQADKNNFSLELFLKILSDAKPTIFKEIIVQFEGVPMKFITHKIENHPNIKLLKKEDIKMLYRNNLNN